MTEADIESLPLTIFLMMDMAIFIKNMQGRYLWANQFFIKKSAGQNSIADIYNKQDCDFPWRDYADQLRLNDENVFDKKASFSVFEQVQRYDGRTVRILSRKSPLFDQNQSLIGLVGLSIEIPKSNITKLLSNREYDVTNLLSQGLTDKEIAKKFEISPRTVEFYINNAKFKLKVSSRSELIAKFAHIPP